MLRIANKFRTAPLATGINMAKFADTDNPALLIS
jgi:hypothetical protein